MVIDLEMLKKIVYFHRPAFRRRLPVSYFRAALYEDSFGRTDRPNIGLTFTGFLENPTRFDRIWDGYRTNLG